MPGERGSIEPALRLGGGFVNSNGMAGPAQPGRRPFGEFRESIVRTLEGTSWRCWLQLVDGSLRWTFLPEPTMAPSPRE
jgi:hypothetical protein